MLTVLQVLALDIGTDLLPALALGAEPPSAGIMQRPPRGPTEHLLDRSVLLRAFGWLGPIEAVTSLGPRWWERRCSSVGLGDGLPTGGPDLAVLSGIVSRRSC